MSRKIKSIKKIDNMEVVELQVSNTYYIDNNGIISHNCKYCKEFYHDGNSFKVYKLSELVANGSNYGKSQDNWQPVLPPAHPNCRHKLVELKEGFELDENGRAMYKG